MLGEYCSVSVVVLRVASAKHDSSRVLLEMLSSACSKWQRSMRDEKKVVSPFVAVEPLPLLAEVS